MFDLFRNKRSTNQITAAPNSIPANSVSQHTDVRRELIRVVLKDTLRRHGIPLDWLACEVIVVTRTPENDDLHIHLVLMKWNEQVLRYAQALQRQLLLDLDRFDPEVDHSRYVISWRFSPDCNNPFAAMPEPGCWQQSVPTKVTQAPVSVLDRRHARRPAKAGASKPLSVSQQSSVSHYEPTQIAPLN